MTMKLDVAIQARRDIREIASFISQDNPQAARSVAAAIKESFLLLLQMPHIGAPRKSYSKELPGLRALPSKRYPHYLIFYIPDELSITIVRVLHSSRDINNIIH